MSLALDHSGYRRDLGNGLVLRWSQASDFEPLSQLYRLVFRDNPNDPPNQRIVAWLSDLMSGKHPLTSACDFALVEDTRCGMIVAATVLLDATWEYAGMPFAVGRPEIVASHPDYRQRGLVRAVFELIHARSAMRGHLAQGITGIPYFYRQFGYEYALDLGGSRSVYLSAIPPHKPDTPEPYTLRAATLADVPAIMALYERERTRDYKGAAPLVSSRIDPAYWHYVLVDLHPDSTEAWNTQVIENTTAQVCGCLFTQRIRWKAALEVVAFMVQPDVALLDVLPSVLRALRDQAATMPTAKPDQSPATSIKLVLGRAHPVYAALGEAQASHYEPPYGWYVRVPDLPGFMRQIAPVLERRLVDSIAAGYSGELKLDFYRGGLKLGLEQGRLTTVEDWRATVGQSAASAGFPPLVFLQLLFGHRSLAELRHSFPDVWASSAATPLLETLFPPQPAWVLPLD